MAHRVVFRPAAQADLFALYTYIAERSGRARAAAYLDRIETTCMRLAVFPERGTRRDDLGQGIRTLGFERRVTIVFRLVADEVEIVTIAYGGRDFEGELTGEH
jgi:toxin ParE1/3/4